MSCDDFERWLDQGGAPEGRVGAAAHAAACPRCARAWRIAETLDAALAEAPAPASRAFTDRVMARVGSGRIPAPLLMPALPWWVRAAMEPATVLALVAAGAMVWGWDGLWAVASAARAELARGAGALPPAAAFSATGWLALQVAAASWLAASAHALFRAAGRLATRFPLTRP